MKRRIIKVIGFGGLLMALIYFIPIAWSNFNTGSYEGYYYCDGQFCGCGHPVFNEIRKDGFFECIPGHNSRKLIWGIEIRSDYWQVDLGPGKDEIRLEIVDGEVVWVHPKSGTREILKRVRNPWVIWFYRHIEKISV
jgi:hypothetical protein